MTAEHRSADVGNRFLQELLEDLDRGAPPPLEEYLARYRGFEDVVTAEYARVVGVRGGDAPAVDAPLPVEAPSECIGPYRVLRELGRGGQGVVYLAEDTRLGRRVALKVLTWLGSLSREHLERFRREASIASRLDHPGICPVYDADTVDGVPYVAMRLVEGETLADEIAELRDADRPPDVTRTVQIVERAARALHAAHAAGVIHRDVKPSNLMIDPGGEPVILDFGLARELDADTPTLTRPGDLFGTPAYMSPEQIEGAEGVDRRTDVYSLGATLYEALTLRPPFHAPTREGLYRAVLSEVPTDPRSLHPDLPRDLVLVLGTALEKDRDLRYQTALDLAGDLRAVVESRAVSVAPVRWPTRLGRWARRDPRRAALVGGGLLATLLAAGFGGYVAARLPAIEAGNRTLEREAAQRLNAAVFDNRVTAEMEVDLRAIAEREPNMNVSLALLHLRNHDDPEGALAVLDSLHGEIEGQPVAGRVRVACLMELGRVDEARELERSLGEPESADDALVSAVLLLDGAETSVEAERRALRLLQRAAFLAERPRPEIYGRLATVAGGLKETDLEELALVAMQHHFPENARTWFFAGSAHIKRDLDLAARDFERAIELDPDLAQPYASLSVVYAFQGDAERARATFEDAIERTAAGSLEQRSLFSARARTLLALGAVEEALEVSERALEVAPDDERALFARGRALLLLDRREEGEAALERVLELQPDHTGARELLGHGLE